MEAALGNHSTRWRATNLQNGFSNYVEGGKELYYRGMSGMGGDTHTLPPQACQGHRDHPRVGQLPPTKVPPVQFDGDLEGFERAAYDHRSV